MSKSERFNNLHIVRRILNTVESRNNEVPRGCGKVPVYYDGVEFVTNETTLLDEFVGKRTKSSLYWVWLKIILL